MTVDYEKSGKEREIYNLWWEYLKRSRSYKEYCEEVRRDKSKHSALIFIPKKFKTTKEQGVHPLARIYRSWGDIHTNTFAKWWKFKKKQLIVDEEKTNKKAIEDYSELVIPHIDSTISSFWEKEGRVPSLEEFKEYFLKRMEGDSLGYLYLFVDVSGVTLEDLIEQFVEIVKERKRDPRIKRHELYLRKNKKLSLDSRIRLDELGRYLQVYDLHKKKVKWKDIIKKVIPYLGSNDENVRRAFLMYLEKAKKIIRNVEEGVFPGDYQ